MTGRGRSPARPGSSLLEIQVAMVVLGIALAGACPIVVMQMKLLRRFEVPRSGASDSTLIRGQRIVDGEPVVPAGEDPDPPVAVLHPHPDRWVRRLGLVARVDEQAGGSGLVPIPTELTLPDADATLVGPWSAVSSPDAAGGTYQRLDPGEGAGTATWTFAAITPGPYRLLLSWPVAVPIPPDALAVVAEVGGLNPVAIPVASADPGRVGSWVDLGNVRLGPGATVRLGRSLKGSVVADAVRIGGRSRVTVATPPATTLGPDQGLTVRLNVGPRP